MSDHDPRTLGDCESGLAPALLAGCPMEGISFPDNVLALSRMLSAVSRHAGGTQEGRRVEHNTLSLQRLRPPCGADASRAGAWSACKLDRMRNVSRLDLAAAQWRAAGLEGV